MKSVWGLRMSKQNISTSGTNSIIKIKQNNIVYQRWKPITPKVKIPKCLNILVIYSSKEKNEQVLTNLLSPTGSKEMTAISGVKH